MTDNFKETNPKAKAATYRLPLGKVPDSLRVFASLGYAEGDAKYGAYNFRGFGVSVMTYIDAIERHIAKFKAGEWADPSTRVPHLANMAADVGIIIDGFMQGNINDDRPPTQPELIKFMDGDAKEIVEHLYTQFNNEENQPWTQKKVEQELANKITSLKAVPLNVLEHYVVNNTEISEY